MRFLEHCKKGNLAHRIRLILGKLPGTLANDQTQVKHAGLKTEFLSTSKYRHTSQHHFARSSILATVFKYYVRVLISRLQDKECLWKAKPRE